jgi:hypothetical protein
MNYYNESFECNGDTADIAQIKKIVHDAGGVCIAIFGYLRGSTPVWFLLVSGYNLLENIETLTKMFKLRTIPKQFIEQANAVLVEEKVTRQTHIGYVPCADCRYLMSILEWADEWEGLMSHIQHTDTNTWTKINEIRYRCGYDSTAHSSPAESPDPTEQGTLDLPPDQSTARPATYDRPAD